MLMDTVEQFLHNINMSMIVPKKLQSKFDCCVCVSVCLSVSYLSHSAVTLHSLVVVAFQMPRAMPPANQSLKPSP